ncbi:hypothetical protein A2526_06710 [candidate division WOR-1 bacterium RIFOXYD2_FULL_36_8]|uniref:Uncharacterized protein n=1 Tax=candidate division WOR-1 bacterium RIFOXYB2_FULL_36_35 TaxID=1802578 RepID=A0A1F4S5J9_UNCSA|nr:MAG: hypothetical protein A2230_04755 [candidate division WOR-1 bacterium RIFOXYA2_FULL_36_21]OGC15715.1 MAG: hypothetical protein A2290_05180 [candidate division WOR-1 bacterium RIFOXYB2_FULL_36_35]OGC21070.1 MAG: hypothetical protein A2282_03510 [candidate division WOR-1 bacterium RIFOXYA12_FULL_36_13]OGC41251.1 MAG: hypothetical protein A2526_06710 [candidate division WOR-1 bacterium RIFOXYD2_FULL_36_8]
MRLMFDSPKKRMFWIVFLAFVLFLPFIATHCGKSASSGGSSSGGGVTPSLERAITVKGLATSANIFASSIKNVRIQASSALADANVTIGEGAKDSEDIVEIATGRTDSLGKYSIEIDVSDLRSDVTDNKVSNLMVIIEKDGVIVGSTLPTTDLTTKTAFAPTANPSGYKKQMIARKVFKKGSDPKDFNFVDNVDRKFSDISGEKFEEMAEAIKAAEDMRAQIAESLGIDVSKLALLDERARTYHDTYIEPIFRQAFENGIPPDRETLDAAFAQMDEVMKDYAVSLGITEQQFVDLRAMNDKNMQGYMQEQLGANDTDFKDMKRRDEGNKMIDLFIAQFDAADTFAQASTASKQSFKNANPAKYAEFLAKKDTVITALKEKMNDTTITDPRAIGDYLRTEFFDAFLFPPLEQAQSSGVRDKKAVKIKFSKDNPEDMEAIMQAYANTRIMVYFMNFFTTEQRGTIFQSMGQTLQPIFQSRYEDSQSVYYMGPSFWESRPTGEEIAARTEKFKTALNNAINSIVSTPFNAVSWVGGTNVSDLINAFVIINAPPDAI